MRNDWALTPEQYVRLLHTAFFDSELDDDKLHRWVAVLEDGGDPTAVAAAFANAEGARANAEGARANAEVPTLTALAARIEDIAASLAHITSRQDLQMEAIRYAGEQEPQTRRLLRAEREDAEYERAWTDRSPLVTVCIPTYNRWESLVDRAIPSALAQQHANVEVVVVGDAAGPEIGLAVETLGDSRVRYENLSVRGPYPDDPTARWYVAGTSPLNRAMQLARGQWIVVLNDDDALRPDHVSTLLAHARETHAEVAYGAIVMHSPDGSTEQILSFPPQSHQFGWQAALQHRVMRLFEYELVSHVFGEPGDWHRARRMVRAGVRFAMVDHQVVDYWPGLLWNSVQ